MILKKTTLLMTIGCSCAHFPPWLRLIGQVPSRVDSQGRSTKKSHEVKCETTESLTKILKVSYWPCESTRARRASERTNSPRTQIAQQNCTAGEHEVRGG